MLDLKITGLKKFHRYEKKVEETVRAVKTRQALFARELVTDLAVTSPRLTGRFQSSWFATLDTPVFLDEVPALTHKKNSIFPDINEMLAQIRGYGRSKGPIRKVIVSNPLHYWRYLEYKYYKGFIKAAVNRAKMSSKVRTTSGKSSLSPSDPGATVGID